MAAKYLLDIGLILFSTKILGIFTRRVYMPQVVGALLAGLFLGPGMLNLIDQSDFLVQTAEIGVIVLMFCAVIQPVPAWKCFFLILSGLVLIIGGGQGVVYSAKGIARAFGMTETLIGLTIVAIGTSLPELVTSIVAAKKGETGLAVGNVIGSNIFNILFILGISSCIHPIAVNVASIYDMIILIGISSLVFFFSITGNRINRLQGFVMLLIYAADIIFAAMR